MRLVILVTWLLSISVGTAYSTIPDSLKHRIDSLKTLLNSPDIEKRYAGEFGIAWELYDVDNPEAVKYARRAYMSAQSISDTMRIMKSGRILGQLLRRVDKPDSAISVLRDVIGIAELSSDSSELSKTINALAAVHVYQAKFDQALVSNLRALKISKAMYDSAGVATSLGNIGLSFYKLNNHAEALRYYHQALAYTGKYSAQLLINIALAKIAARDSAGFVEFVQKAITAAPSYQRDHIQAQCHFAYGWHYYKLQLYDSSIARYRKAWESSNKLNDTRISAESRLGIGRCYLVRGHYDSALLVLEGVEDDLIQGKYMLLCLLYYDIKSNALESLGRITDALQYRNKHRALNDSITDREITNNIMMARLKFDEEQNEILMNKQTENILLKEQIITRQRMLLLISFAFVIVLLWLMAVLYRFSQYQKRIAKQLDQRVFERTQDLQATERILTKRLEETRAVLSMISSRVNASVATVRGLYNIASSEPIDINEIKSWLATATTDLSQMSQVVLRIKELQTLSDQKN